MRQTEPLPEVQPLPISALGPIAVSAMAGGVESL